MTVDDAVTAAVDAAETQIVTTELLGRAAVPDLPYTNSDGSPLRIDADYFGDERDGAPTPGPFENLPGGGGDLSL
jgi:alpha-N-arabinofuranosidase